MEDFATKEQKGIREKSIYILHLDTPRIIILTSVIIGLVIIAALIGMNINKQDQRDNESFAHDNSVLDNLAVDSSEKAGLSENSNIEPPFNNDNILKNKENDNSIITADNSLKPKDIFPNSQGTFGSSNNNISKEPATDILTHENIETIIPPAHVMKKSDNKKSASQRKTNEKRPDKIKENTKKKGVVEVSKSLKASEKDKNYFSIQVAAFDKKSKALSEISNLENKNTTLMSTVLKLTARHFIK